MTQLERLMLVTDRHAVPGGDLAGAVRAAVAGGVGLVHVREKDLDDARFAALLAELAAPLPRHVRLIVNGRPELARRTGVGLHLAPGALAARPAGIDLLGASVHDEEEALQALALAPDYLLAGTIFPSRSKPGRRPAGTAWIAQLRRLAGEVPIYGIGGIDAANAAAVIGAGAHGVAVRSAILAAPDARAAASALARAIGLAVAKRE